MCKGLFKLLKRDMGRAEDTGREWLAGSNLIHSAIVVYFLATRPSLIWKCRFWCFWKGF